jgi:ABC-type multidrug transport system permease subunit
LIILPASTGILLIVISKQNHIDPMRPAVGAAMLSTANAVLFGTAFAMMNERNFGTLRLWLSSPQGFLESMMAKSAIHIANGILTGAITFALVGGMADMHMTGRRFGLLLCELTGALSSGGLGMFCVALSLWTRDTFGLPNIFRALMMIASGALVSPSALFVNIRWLSPLIPLHHAVGAALRVARGQGIPWSAIGLEIGVGLGWAVAGFFVFHRLLFLARQEDLMELD